MPSRGMICAIAIVVGILTVVSVIARDVPEIRVEDKCDANTFPLDAGCTREGGVTFEEFSKKLNSKDGGHSAWRFHFVHGAIEANEKLRVVNAGGAPHTFTKVATFGGGFVAALSTPFGFQTPIPECELPDARTTFLLPGEQREVADLVGPLTAGTHHFQCCIHPWMRLDIQVR